MNTVWRLSPTLSSPSHSFIPHLLMYLLAWKLHYLPLTLFLSTHFPYFVSPSPCPCSHWLCLTFAHLALVGQDGTSCASINPAEWQDSTHTHARTKCIYTLLGKSVTEERVSLFSLKQVCTPCLLQLPGSSDKEQSSELRGGAHLCMCV